MAYSSFSHPRRPDAPAPSGSGGYAFDVRVPQFPIYIVTKASELPLEFLYPAPSRQLVIGFDCEGIELSRDGLLCVMQLAFHNAIYLVDVVRGGAMLMYACKPALESASVIKVIHDCKRDGEALYFQYGIKLNNVMDTQIAYNLIEQQEGRMRLQEQISFVGLLADHRYCGVSYHGKEEIRFLLRQDPSVWYYRPMSGVMVHAAADDVRFLQYLYNNMMGKLTEQSRWRLAVLGALRCRCFCICENNQAEWPPIPPTPDILKVGGNAHEEEVLSFIDVPQGKMGLVVGRRGGSILAIKAACNAEIIIGGDRGPANKVIVIGPESEVMKAGTMVMARITV